MWDSIWDLYEIFIWNLLNNYTQRYKIFLWKIYDFQKFVSKNNPVLFYYFITSRTRQKIFPSRASAKKFPGEGTEKTSPKNNIIKPLSTLSVPCIKFHGEPQPLLPSVADARASNIFLFWRDKTYIIIIFILFNYLFFAN